MNLEKTLAEQICFSVQNTLNEAADPHHAGLRSYIVTLNDIINKFTDWRSILFSAEMNKPYNLKIIKDNGASYVKVYQRMPKTQSDNTQITLEDYRNELTVFDDEQVNEICILIKPKNGGADPNENTKACFFDKQYILDCVESNILKTHKTKDGLMIDVSDRWAKENCQYMIKYAYAMVSKGVTEINPGKK